jgi:hypothetical protein
VKGDQKHGLIQKAAKKLLNVKIDDQPSCSTI